MSQARTRPRRWRTASKSLALVTLVAAAAAIGGSALLGACGSFDDTSEPTATTDASTAKKDSSVDAEVDADAGASLPNHAALISLVQSTFTDQLVKNPIVYSYFVPNTQAGHSPTLADIQECLAYQLGAIMQNGDVYPPAAKLADGYTCRPDMTTIHQSLDIPGPVFNELVSALVVESAVDNIVLPADTETQLFGLASQIVDPNAPDAALGFGWQNLDAGGDGGDGGDAGDAGKTKDAGTDAGSDAGDASADSGADAAG